MFGEVNCVVWNLYADLHMQWHWFNCIPLALENGHIAIYQRSSDGYWCFDDYRLLYLGPHPVSSMVGTVSLLSCEMRFYILYSWHFATIGHIYGVGLVCIMIELCASRSSIRDKILWKKIHSDCDRRLSLGVLRERHPRDRRGNGARRTPARNPRFSPHFPSSQNRKRPLGRLQRFRNTQIVLFRNLPAVAGLFSPQDDQWKFSSVHRGRSSALRAFALRTKSRFFNRENQNFSLNANTLNVFSLRRDWSIDWYMN